ncbi:putative pre-mRNA-splicing factor ATP-dependent RNA helicase [Smittium culicis]|uniref:Putative pre-mRNA-splicing factor ATP-dependent RNA helicase n=1 Tax=Smittium culicis TaxID=133412 RepID=A0A1R1X9N1_9FUNG|nr:putative pre-mRNA-splicing factor ATP-dependent RNA helicase [Smittium culicis]OMJ24506.1 putative pre-mRNA-splicing factor ATP-dependent RNA helicase [Smittium culicis]
MPISKSLADTRSSIVKDSFGSGFEGKCYRLYPLAVYKEGMPEFDVPEINRIGPSKLSRLLLLVLLLIGNSANSTQFDIIPPGPSREGITSAIESLSTLGIIELGKKEKKITQKEYQIIHSIVLFNLEPSIGVCLLSSLETINNYNGPNRFLPSDFSNNMTVSNSSKIDISLEMIIVASMLSAGTVFTESNRRGADTDSQKLKFASKENHVYSPKLLLV